MYPNVALQTRKCSRNSSSLWRGTSVSHHDGARSRTQYSWTRRPPEAVRAVVLTATPAAIRAACVALSAACSDGGARRRYCGHHPAAVVDRHPSRRSGEKWRERPSAAGEAPSRALCHARSTSAAPRPRHTRYGRAPTASPCTPAAQGRSLTPTHSGDSEP